jgi:hypothetical protein
MNGLQEKAQQRQGTSVLPPAAATISTLGSSREAGLASDEASRRLAQEGLD